tara:strand:- start:392 stop:1006 length:615 start_codon:yes stop_codon:yes gene_type:complete
MHKNPVIIFEGVETSGKSTNIQNVSNFLKKIRRKYIKIREPGGSKNSEKIRKLILNKRSTLNKKTDLLLMLASRSENIDKIIKKNYKKKIILIDRFTDSTIAYQHYGMGLNIKLINILNNYIVEKFKPNLTFLSLVNKKNMKKRLKLRINTNKYDNFNYAFYNKVQKGFLKLSKRNKNYIILDSNNNNSNEIKKILINNIKKII